MNEQHPITNLFQIKTKGCRKPGPDGTWNHDHRPIIVDEQLSQVECGTCGEKLNPIMVLLTYARNENGLKNQWQLLQDAINKQKFKMERQNRVRCEHCSKLTKIRKGGG